jgi:dynactin complex subunit
MLIVLFLKIFISKLYGSSLEFKIEELKGELKAKNLLLKDKEFQFNKNFENYETQICRLNDENKQIKEKYEK